MTTTITNSVTGGSLWFDIGWSDEENNDNRDYEAFQEELAYDIYYQDNANVDYSFEHKYYGYHGLPW